jgi:hypothetical protein
MKTLQVTLHGFDRIMFHNEQLADPTNPYARKLKSYPSSSKITDEQYEERKWLEWRAGWYIRDGRPVLPADNLRATLRDGAKQIKVGRGTLTAAAKTVVCGEPFFSLKYDGPETVDEMQGDGRFLDFRGVRVGSAKVMRARPVLRGWSVSPTFLYDPEVVSGSQLIRALDIAGMRIGICERRPADGRFEVAA